MIQIIIALTGVFILTVILLLLPSVFSKMVTLLHIFLTAVYFFIGLLLNHYFHWSVVGSVVFLLVLSTAFLLAKQSNILNLSISGKRDYQK